MALSLHVKHIIQPIKNIIMGGGVDDCGVALDPAWDPGRYEELWWFLVWGCGNAGVGWAGAKPDVSSFAIDRCWSRDQITRHGSQVSAIEHLGTGKNSLFRLRTMAQWKRSALLNEQLDGNDWRAPVLAYLLGTMTSFFIDKKMVFLCFNINMLGTHFGLYLIGGELEISVRCTRKYWSA